MFHGDNAPMAAPNAICTKGRGNDGKTRDSKLLRTTANRNRMMTSPTFMTRPGRAVFLRSSVGLSFPFADIKHLRPDANSARVHEKPLPPQEYLQKQSPQARA